MTEGEFMSGLWSEQLPYEISPGCVSLLSVSWEPVRSWVRAPHAHSSRLLQPHGATFWAFPQASGTQGAPFLAWGSMVGVGSMVRSFSDSRNSISSWSLPLGNVGFLPPQRWRAASGGGRGGSLGGPGPPSPLEDFSQKDMHPSALTRGSSEGLCIQQNEPFQMG